MKVSKNSIIYGSIANPTIITFDEILYCVADNNYTEIYTSIREKPFVFSATLKETEEKLGDKRFYRINRGVLINIEYLSIFKNDKFHDVYLKNGSYFPVATRRKVAFKRYMKNYKVMMN